MVEDEPDPTPEELREAQALARALAADVPETEAPRDALETAALLRSTRSTGVLAPERERARAAGVGGAAPGERRPRPRRWLPVMALGASLALVASLLLFLRPSGPPSAPGRPPLELLEAQARAAAREPGALTALDREMQLYRRQIHSSLGIDPGAPQ